MEGDIRDSERELWSGAGSLSKEVSGGVSTFFVSSICVSSRNPIKTFKDKIFHMPQNHPAGL
jgi:hypothetical protein